jgi:predicted nucleic acid-binding protein
MRSESAILKIDALLDSNVLIAMLVEAHEHHGPSLNLLIEDGPQFAISAHSFAEAYSTLTRRSGPAPFQFTPGEAWAALESVRAVTSLVGLTAPQTLEAIRTYALSGGVGPRLYDRLIGEAAAIHGIPAVITWNVSHMRSLFPALAVVTPAEFADAPPQGNPP